MVGALALKSTGICPTWSLIQPMGYAGNYIADWSAPYRLGYFYNLQCWFFQTCSLSNNLRYASELSLNNVPFLSNHYTIEMAGYAKVFASVPFF